MKKVFIVSVSMALIFFPLQAQAQQVYSYYEAQALEREHRCNQYLYYLNSVRGDEDSECRIVKQMHNANCNILKGYPSYGDKLQTCRRHGK